MTLKGIAASSGLTEGRVKFYSPGTIYSKSEILVSRNTTPEMCIEILNAGAIVTENGGILSHAAIFCREIKKTCVVGVKDVLKTLNEGDNIIVDGDKGEIIIL